MSYSLLLLNGKVVNEGQTQEVDIAIKEQRIHKIGKDLSKLKAREVIDLAGNTVIPGMIDDQVHFREPGLTQKGSIATESKAAVAGGITSFMEMPNCNPITDSSQQLQTKQAIAARNSYANYSFYLGATQDNIEEIKCIDPTQVCGIKVFMGASTGNMLVDDPKVLENIFAYAPTLIATHCEDTPTILANEQKYRNQYGDDIPIRLHAHIRSREACIKSTQLALQLAHKFDAKLHVLHLTTAEEAKLFIQGPIEQKRITAEACVHHLFFSEQDYEQKGTLIKCNPSIKSEADRTALLHAVRDGHIDIIATDHAPHTFAEKNQSYWTAPAGLPLVQHALLSLLEHVHDKTLSLNTLVEKTSHNVAKRYQILKRGYIREGYFADLALIDLSGLTTATHTSSLYQCQWTPFEGTVFRSKILGSIVNGGWAYKNLEHNNEKDNQNNPVFNKTTVKPLEFETIRR